MYEQKHGIATFFLAASAFWVVLVVIAVFGFLIAFALPVVFSEQGLSTFTATWLPTSGQFGILPMLATSFCLAFLSLILGFPLSLGLCCCLHGFVPRPLAKVLGILVRGMTAIPTVVYGFAAIFLLVPLVRKAFDSGSGFCWLSASLVLAVSIIPTMTLVMDAGLRHAVHRLGITGAALGFSSTQMITHLALPLCRMDMLAAAALGFGRAIGDTLIPLMLAGNAPQWPLHVTDSVRTLTAHIGLVMATDSHSAAYGSLFVAGCLLLGANLIVQLILRLCSRKRSMQAKSDYDKGDYDKGDTSYDMAK